MNDRQSSLQLQGTNLVTIAVLKSVQINQTINFLYNQVFSLTTRVLFQHALINYNVESQPADTQFGSAYTDLSTAISTQSQILEGRVYSPDFVLLPNLTVSTVTYSLPDALWPTTIPPISAGSNETSAGQLLGPLPIADVPGSYALSLTIPVVNTNTSSTPVILGYMSCILTASGLLKAVNDSTGMGATGQLLVVAQNGSQYDVVLPPLRTPQIYEEDFLPRQYPAVDLAFANKTGPGYLIDTHNAAGDSVSVGYTVHSPFLGVGRVVDSSYPPYDTSPGQS